MNAGRAGSCLKNINKIKYFCINIRLAFGMAESCASAPALKTNDHQGMVDMNFMRGGNRGVLEKR